MCSAVRLRMFVCGMTVSRSPERTSGSGDGRLARRGRGRGRGGRGRGRRGAAAAGAGGGGRPRPSAAARTSLRVMRPPTPVPVIVRGIEAVLGDQPAHHRRQQAAAPPADGGGRRRGARRRRGGGRGGPAAGAGAGCGAPARCGAGSARGRGLRLGVGLGRGLRARRRRPAPRRGAAPPSPIDREHHADVDGVALRHLDLGERAAHRRRHLGVDLVGGHLEQRLVLGDGVADRLEPLRDRALGDGLTELGHRDVGHRRVRLLYPCSARPVRLSIASPSTSAIVGWGWIR